MMLTIVISKPKVTIGASVIGDFADFASCGEVRSGGCGIGNSARKQMRAELGKV
ncbi:MAG: hypothetical protein QOD80_186 [Verrucomicrobiota bacterium]|jgi:hypothetical protein